MPPRLLPRQRSLLRLKPHPSPGGNRVCKKGKKAFPCQFSPRIKSFPRSSHSHTTPALSSSCSGPNGSTCRLCGASDIPCPALQYSTVVSHFKVMGYIRKASSKLFLALDLRFWWRFMGDRHTGTWFVESCVESYSATQCMSSTYCIYASAPSTLSEKKKRSQGLWPYGEVQFSMPAHA
jgi:hypothetical protein